MTSRRSYQTGLSVLDSGRLAAHFASLAPQSEPEQVVSLDHYVRLLRRHLWKISLAVTLCTVLTYYLCTRITPVYESTATIVIDKKAPSSIVGDEPAPNGDSDIDQIVNTEIRTIQSDAVLRPVAEEYQLLDGKNNADNNRSLLDKDAPIVLKGLTVARIPNSLIITISYRSTDPRQAALIANSIARSYITRGMEMRANSAMGMSAFMEKQIAELKRNMDVSEQALAGYVRELGLIDPDEKTSILAARLLQLNTQYTDAENDRIRKETDYRALQSGSAAALEISPQGAELTVLERQMRAAEERFAEAKTIYGPNYAEYKRAANDLAEVTRQYEQTKSQIAGRVEADYNEALHRESMLRGSLAGAKDELDKQNEDSFQYQQLKREADANTSLYSELFRKIKEAGINAGFQVSSIRLTDEARPQSHPVFPRKGLFTFLSFFLSTLGSLIVIILMDMFNHSLRDPEHAHRLTGVEVVGTLPRVRRFDGYGPTLPNLIEERAVMEGKRRLSLEFYKESICTLLASVLFARITSGIRSILITSAGPGEGKSSCAAHMAIAHAERGKKTLLIDADLRRPYQHTFFNLSNDVGLADVIARGATLSEIRQSISGLDTLDVIVTGDSSETIYHRVGSTVARLLTMARGEYELIIIDAPPMLFLAEPIQIASLADGVLVVSNAEQTHHRSVARVLTILRRVHAKVIGIVLNEVRLDMSASYQPYRDYERYKRRLLPKAG